MTIPLTFLQVFVVYITSFPSVRGRNLFGTDLLYVCLYRLSYNDQIQHSKHPEEWQILRYRPFPSLKGTVPEVRISVPLT